VSNKAIGRPGTGYDGLNVTQAFYQWGQRKWDMDKMKTYMLPDGFPLTWNRTSWDDPTPKYTDNPYWVRRKNYQNDNRNRLFGNLGASYQLAPNWAVELKVMTDFYTDRQEERIAIGSVEIPKYRLYQLTHTENNYQGFIRYDNRWGENFSFNGFVGGSIMKRSRVTAGGETVGGLSSDIFNLAASLGRPTLYDRKIRKQINSAFASASFGYLDQLFLDITARNDWSSTLPPKHNSYFYPSASPSWIFTESAAANLNWLSFGKLRVAIASVGNDTDPYHTMLTYQLRQPFGSNTRVTVPNIQPNTHLKPEITTEYELGADLKFFRNRLGLSLSYYNRQTKNQIMALNQSASTGYTSRYINAGLIENKGTEFSLTANPIRKKDFRWDLSFNFARNRNLVVKLTPNQKTIVLATAPFAVQIHAREGESYGSIVGYNYVFDENGNKIVNSNGRYRRSAEQEVLGNVLPDYVGGVSNSLRYKGVSLSALIDFQKGGKFFSTTEMYGRYTGMLEETAAGNIRNGFEDGGGIIAEGVYADGQPNTRRLSADSHFYYNGGYVINAANVVDASYIYLRELKLSYALPADWFTNKGIQNASIAFNARNVWLIRSNSKHIDPSNITSSITNVQGIEGAALPSVRSFGFTVSLGF
jgi:outer membrane receptor protein involved in Fe transport